MYAEIDEEMIVQTISAYNQLTDHIQDLTDKAYQNLYQRMEQKEKDEFIFASSMPGGKIAEPIIPPDVSSAYEHYINLCHEQIKNTYRYIREYSERQETMNRIMICYNYLPPEEHMVLQIFYEEGNGYTAGVLAAKTQLHMSESTILRYRRKALDGILKMYNSEQSLMEMICGSEKYR